MTAKLENGPYKGGILSGSIETISKDGDTVETEIAFQRLDGKPIPVGLKLVTIRNTKGVEGSDDQSNKIVANSSENGQSRWQWGSGRERNRATGGRKGAAIGAAAGAGAGFVLNMKLTAASHDIDLQPGGEITLNAETGGAEGGDRKRVVGKDR